MSSSEENAHSEPKAESLSEPGQRQEDAQDNPEKDENVVDSYSDEKISMDEKGSVEKPSLESNASAAKSKKSEIFKEIANNALLSSMKKSRTKTKTPTKRLIIKEIVLENFKSYQGIQRIGPFHKRFTSVVGPNGSGKSNLIESLLFVFGKRATWMRLNKLYELIHNSSHHQGNKRASVEVSFCEIIDKGEEDYEVVADSHFSVKRVVHHTSVSNYEVDGRDANQKEVVELLQSKGIDLTNHRFLILQGEVEQISLMKPKTGKQDDPGLLEYLEDIIGSYVYKEKIEGLDEEYLRLYDRKREKNDIVNLSKMELLKLESAKNVAVEYIRKEKQIFQLMNVSHQIARHKANREVMKSEEAVAEVTGLKKEEEKKIRDKIKDKDNLLKNYRRKKQELDEIKDRIQTLDNRIRECEAKDIALSKDLERTLKEAGKYQDQIATLEREYNKIIENANEIKRNIPEKSQQLGEFLKRKDGEEAKLQAMMSDLHRKAERFRTQKREIESRLEPFQKAFSQLKNEASLLTSELNYLASNSSNFSQEIAELAERSKSLSSKSQEIQAILGEIDKAFAKMTEIKADMNLKLEKIRSEEEVVLRDLSELQAKLDESKSNATEQHQRNHILNELLKAQQRREVSGIHGRLGDLGTIDEKFDVAISSACPALENIVVARIEDAVKAVEYLRSNKIGRATFISLEKTAENPHLNRGFNAPAGSQRLFDLVRPRSEEYRAVFYAVLRDTLVCEDLDLATSIAYGATRYRVVTTNGVVIETTGAMSGGGKPRRGGMAAKAKDGLSLEQVSELNERRRAKILELEEIRRKKAMIESELGTVMRDEGQALKEKRKFETELEFVSQQMRDVEAKGREIQRIKDTRGRDDEKKRELEKRLLEKRGEIMKAEGSIAPIMEEKSILEQKIAEIGGEELRNQQRVCDETVKGFENCERELAKLTVVLDTLPTGLSKNEAERQKAEKARVETENRVKQLKGQQEKLEEETLAIMGSKKAAIEKRDQMEGDFKKESEEKEELERILQELKSTLARFNEQIEENKQVLKRAKDEYNRWNGELEKCRKSYTEAVSAYDFLDELDEIASFHVSEQQQPPAALNTSVLNDSLLEISMSLPSSQPIEILDDEGANGNPKKKVKIALSTQTLEAIDVFQDLSMEQLDNIEKLADRIKMKIAAEQEKFKELQPNITSISEFRTKFLEHKVKTDDLEKARVQIDDLKNQVDNLKKTRFDEFMAGFNQINCKLKETYQLLTNGGDAELELIDTFDPFAEGVSFSVRPPKKSWKQMTKLSGGEKTLSSLALVFALHYFKPTPLYFMDEIDAALDFKNVGIVAKYIKERTKDAQFIIISLRNNMFELANKLVGVYKTFDTTKTIAIVPSMFQQQGAIVV